MSFQITILKVLAGHPGGRASLADLRRAVAILISSGTDWTNRTKRLAARAPDLDRPSVSRFRRKACPDDGQQRTSSGSHCKARADPGIAADKAGLRETTQAPPLCD